MTQVDTEYQLGDRYVATGGRVYLSGVQALVRLPLVQRLRDEAGGLSTAGFVSGYRGSPLGTFDLALWQAKNELEQARVRFEPGLNEDLAATAVWGSQQAGLLEGARYDGVFGMWYGKGPGVDRSCDALKHANHAGVARVGGVLALAGDDHGAKSSSLAHQSEQAFVHCGIPVLYPSDVQEYLDYGLLGWAMSRFSGLWVAMKCVTDVVETSASVDASVDRVQVVLPEDDGSDRWIGWSMPGVGVEQKVHMTRLPAAQRFVRANRLDRQAFGAARPRLGIVTAGKAYGDVRRALADLGVDAEEAERLGVAVYKVAMTWPLEPEGLREFADGVERLLVVEEKRPLLEDQMASILYPLADRPRLAGKRDDGGRPLLPSHGELDPSTVAEAIARWLDRPVPSRRTVVSLGLGGAALSRRPAFCAGCPHNTSTVVPDGSYAHGGIGCHGMAAFIPARRTLAYTHMGGEGANWIGHAPFTDTPHIFQNVGDGTFEHSGSLVVRAAVAAGVDITFKVLVNGAVAMTGGQPLEGHEALDGAGLVRSIAKQLDAEGVGRIAVVTDAPRRHRRARLPAGVTVHHRDELDKVQRQLRNVPGVTAIVYDQVCAAEARRLRKRGRMEEPDERVVINEAVCEGCGDCGVQSNCIAIEPSETRLGRKRRIDQDACNKDYSCLRGYCPSFAVVSNATLLRPKAAEHRFDDRIAALPAPPAADADRPTSILVAGIGGTGVVTVGALLGVAAHLEGKACTVLDVTGLAQKNGPVSSHVRIAAQAADLHGARIGRGAADVVIGCDMVVTASPENLAAMAAGKTVAVVNRDVAPTSDFAADPDLDLSTGAMESAIASAAGPDGVAFVEATRLARVLLGDSVATNVLLLGFVAQRGLLPVSLAALERAIELNGVKVEANRRALGLGRLAAHDLAAVAEAARPPAAPAVPASGEPDLEEFVRERAALLRAHGARGGADRYLALVERVGRHDEAATGVAGPLTRAVASAYFKLLSYKDEFEVARLWLDPAFTAYLDELFEPGYVVRPQLAPQRGFRADPRTGRVKKRTFGRWIFPAFRVMVAARFLRGTPLDFFGRSTHRRRERALIGEYKDMVEEVLLRLSGETYDTAVALASVPERIRGFGVVKDESIVEAKAAEEELLASLRAVASPVAASSSP